MKTAFFCIFLIFASAYSVFGQTSSDDLVILLDGEKQKTIEYRTIKEMKSVQVDFYDYSLRTTTAYKGVPLLSLINLEVPGQMKKIVEFEFISKNGYKSYVPVENFSKVDGILTYAPVSDGKFEHLSAAEKKIVPLGPYYLVWDFKTLGKEDKFQFSSIYQINKINLITNTVDFGVHDAKADEAVVLGYRTYKKYCLSCHAIDTWGGDVSMDLLKKNILEKKGAAYITNYALDPHAINPQTKMLPLPKYKNRTAMAEAMVVFLKFVKTPNEYIKDNKIDSDKARHEVFKTILLDLKSGIKK